MPTSPASLGRAVEDASPRRTTAMYWFASDDTAMPRRVPSCERTRYSAVAGRAMTVLGSLPSAA